MNESQVAPRRIEKAILLIRGQKVMLDSDLAALYGVETKVLKRAVRRNRDRFPEDFMFQLSREENEILRCQIGTLKWGAHPKYTPYVFTEQGVAMLSGVLASKRAVQVNIAIMRAFVRLRETVAANRDLASKLAELERRIEAHDEGIRSLFDAIRELMTPNYAEPKKIGFDVRERAPAYRTRKK